MQLLTELAVKIFADGADKKGMMDMYQSPFIKGFTTNPTLMKKAGITDYKKFAVEILELIPDRPVSFEVFSDDFLEMEHQAFEIASWGDNVYVKIPVSNTKGLPTYGLIKKLADAGVKLNVTALMTLAQVRDVSYALSNGPNAFISVFAGRIADTGQDPLPLMLAALQLISLYPQLELIWASPREVLNIFQAHEIGCHVITVTNDLLNKLDNINKDLQQFSLETVRMFYRDAQEAGYKLVIDERVLTPSC